MNKGDRIEFKGEEVVVKRIDFTNNSVGDMVSLELDITFEKEINYYDEYIEYDCGTTIEEAKQILLERLEDNNI